MSDFISQRFVTFWRSGCRVHEERGFAPTTAAIEVLKAREKAIKK